MDIAFAGLLTAVKWLIYGYLMYLGLIAGLMFLVFLAVFLVSAKGGK